MSKFDRLPWCLVGVVAVLTTSGRAVQAADVQVRLIAADRKPAVPVSDLVDFRRSPDGGLIATQWLSGLRLNDKPVFEPVNLKGGLPSAPVLAKKSGTGLDDIDDLLKDIKKGQKTKTKIRPVDVVDKIYQGKTLSDGTKVGPKRFRHSYGTITVDRSGVLEPTGVRIGSRSGTVDIPCYPVTITVAAPSGFDSAATFVPRLTWRGRDLLADCLFEHSPDMPLGDTATLKRVAAEGLLGWLAATKGCQRRFRQLTVYLPANSDSTKSEPYVLNGYEFRVGREGVALAIRRGSATDGMLRTTGGFNLVWTLRKQDSPPSAAIAVLSDLAPGWTSEQAGILNHPLAAGAIRISVNSPTGEQSLLRPELPHDIAGEAIGKNDADSLGNAYVVLLCNNTQDETPVARVFAVPTTTAQQAGSLSLRIRQFGTATEERLPNAFGATLTAWTDADSKTVVGLNARPQIDPLSTHTLRFQSSAKDEWLAGTSAVPTGLYALRIDLKPTTTVGIPIVVATKGTQGSVSLLTYHNRRDYLRNERIHVNVLTRGLTDVKAATATFKLTHHTGEQVTVGRVNLNCPAGQSRSKFVTIHTSELRLGRYTLAAETGGTLITYPLTFTLYPYEPRTTFALYSWMVGSFSGPIKSGEKTLVNCLLSQKPTQFLTPTELNRLTDQQTFPDQFRAAARQDVLFPAPESCDRYDADTEREAAVAMRMGFRYCPDYGWGMNSQEAAWNPKHTLPEELARIRRLASQVTQRHRDFGSFGGLHLNWYPRLNGNWEAHPATDGNAVPRRVRLAKEVGQLQIDQNFDVVRKDNPGLDKAVRSSKYRIGAYARAYRDWTERARTLAAGFTDVTSGAATNPKLPPSVAQPGLFPNQPVYTSFLPVSWFHQHRYYPSVYHSTLPVAGVHAYTDYGFSPFQPLWAIDYWAAGVGDQPVWMTTMSNGRDIMLRHALLAAGRGADGIDINGQDNTTAEVISDFMTSYGPYFRTLKPESDVAIITSLSQQIVHGQLVGKWMGYTGGTYFSLYTHLWNARRPPVMLPEENVTLDQLKKFKAVFLLNQQVRFPEPAMQSLKDYVAAGGRIFKDLKTSEDYPGDTFSLNPSSAETKTKWDFEKYRETRDRHFVGNRASYETIAGQLDKLLADVSLPRVTSRDHNTLVATLAGQDTSVVMAVNQTPVWPGIHHPWNFWSATVMAAAAELTFDKPYVLYDVLAGSTEIQLKQKQNGRYVLPVSFDRCSGRSYILTNAPIRSVRLRTLAKANGGPVVVEADVVDATGKVIRDPLPFEISVIDDNGETVQSIYRALGGDHQTRLSIPAVAQAGQWRIRARELASGRYAEAIVDKLAAEPTLFTASDVLIPRPDDVRRFLKTVSSEPARKEVAKNEPKTFDPLIAVSPATESTAAESADTESDSAVTQKQIPASTPDKSVVILLERQQQGGSSLRDLATDFADQLRQQGRKARIETIDPLQLVEVPQRWQLNSRDQSYVNEAVAGNRVIVAGSLLTRHYRGNDGGAGALDTLHPQSGWTEPAARHRIHDHVILLGTMQSNRFLRDVHETVGMRATENFPAAGSALVQVVFDAFTARHDALTIQAHDVAGLRRGVDSVVAMLGTKPKSPIESDAASISDAKLAETTGDQQLPPSNPIRDVFGAVVHPGAFTKDGDLLAWAGTQANNYFLFDGNGQLKKKWLGKYAVKHSGGGNAMWIHDWWGVPGYVNTIVRADADARPQWLMDAPRYSGSYTDWRHPGSRTITDPASDDLFVSGHRQVSRIAPDGKVVWRYDDTATYNDVYAFRFARDMMLHGVSSDGKYLLVAAFGIEPYARIVAKFVRPSVMLFDAATGKLIWEKPNLLIDHSACGFLDDKIVLADATEGKKRLMLVDFAGKELWSMARPQGTSQATLSPDGQWLIVRPEAPRGVNRVKLGPPKGLQAIRLSDKSTRDFQLTDQLATWQMMQANGRVLVSTEDGRLRCFEPDTTQVWEQRFPGPTNILVSPDGKQVVIGTKNGMLQWLDADGKVLRKTDLMSHNMVSDVGQYISDYTAAPSDVPVAQPTPAPPPRIDRRCGAVVKFSKNLLQDADEFKPYATNALTGSVTTSVQAAEAGTYVMSVQQRSAGGNRPQPSDLLVAEISRSGEPKPFYSAQLPISAAWQERTLAFQLPKPGKLNVTLRYESAKNPAGVEFRESGLFAIKFPSKNAFAQRDLSAPLDPLDRDKKDDLSELLGGIKIDPPSVRFFMPNDVNLTARSGGAAPFPQTIPFANPFDGKFAGQKTSWLNKPLNASTHGQLQLKFKKPVPMTALTVYEDATSAGHYTDSYAVFIHDAEKDKWIKVGHVLGNRSPFNLFTFKPITADAITYLWLKSADGHARVAEMQGYFKQDVVLPE